MRTIPRNQSARIGAIFAGTIKCHIHALSNGFEAEDCKPAVAQHALGEFQSARLIDKGNGQYTVRVCGNEWYDLSTEEVRQ